MGPGCRALSVPPVCAAYGIKANSHSHSLGQPLADAAAIPVRPVRPGVSTQVQQDVALQRRCAQ